MPEENRIADVILHPVRMKIIHHLGGRNMTTTQLREAMPEVKQATLYRHVSALLKADVLTVIAERQVRGTTERTLALGEQLAHVDQQEMAAMNDVQLRSAFMSFLSALAVDFEDLLDNGDAEARGSLGFGRGPLYVDEVELERLQEQFNEMLAPYLEHRHDEQRRVSLATVLLPETSDQAPAVDQ